jgi:hypothetical protein
MSQAKTVFITPLEYIINLDLPPRERWKHAVNENLQRLAPLGSYLRAQKYLELGIYADAASSLMSWIQTKFYLPQELHEELLGIAEITESIGLSFVDLYSFNIGYDVLAYCTSTTTTIGSTDGTPYHLRNMDWDEEIAECLCNLTVNAIFQRDGKTLFKTTTWIGHVGLLTACSNEFSISLNYRHTGESLGAMKNVLAILAGWTPIVVQLRLLMEMNYTYEQAVSFMTNVYIASTCYLVVTGNKPNQGALLTRQRTDTLKPIDLSDRDFIVQTNIDHLVHSTDPLWAKDDILLQNALERRIQGEKNLREYQPETDFKQFAFELLSKSPTCNSQTIYQVVMHPATFYYESKIVK